MLLYIQRSDYMLLDKLTKRENLVMSILWNNNNSLSAAEIKELCEEEISIYTVQQVLQRLLKKGYIKVAEIVQNNKSFMRKYVPVLTQTKYISSFINKKTSFELASNYIETTNNIQELNALEQLIKQKKEEL